MDANHNALPPVDWLRPPAGGAILHGPLHHPTMPIPGAPGWEPVRAADYEPVGGHPFLKRVLALHTGFSYEHFENYMHDQDVQQGVRARFEQELWYGIINSHEAVLSLAVGFLHRNGAGPHLREQIVIAEFASQESADIAETVMTHLGTDGDDTHDPHQVFHNFHVSPLFLSTANPLCSLILFALPSFASARLCGTLMIIYVTFVITAYHPPTWTNSHK